MTEQLGLFDGRSSRPAELVEIPLSFRESSKARRLTLRLLPPHTLELVVPRGTKPAKVQAFVTEHRRWIERARQEIAARYEAGSDRVPATIELPAVAQTWNVRYLHGERQRPACRVVAGDLEVHTRGADPKTVRRLLRSWLRAHATECLSPWLLREAARVGRRPRRIQIRLQRTRWGSCSGTGSISLNASLLFVPQPLVRYLLIHELCHLFSLNHSGRFWNAVEQFESDYRTLDRRLTEAWSLVPLWVHGA